MTVREERPPVSDCGPSDLPGPSSVLRARVWLVFARRKYEESLYQVGTVAAEDADMAEVYARSIYDEHPWIEMVVLPRDAVRRVIVP